MRTPRVGRWKSSFDKLARICTYTLAGNVLQQADWMAFEDCNALFQAWEPYQDKLWKITRSSLMNVAQLSSLYSFVGTRCHLRLAMGAFSNGRHYSANRVLLDGYDQNTQLYAPAETTGDHLPFTTERSPPAGRAPRRYVSRGAFEFAYAHDDGVAYDQYTDMLDRRFDDVVMGAIAKFVQGQNLDLTQNADGSRNHNWTCHRLSYELPVFNPFAMFRRGAKDPRFKFVQTQADFVCRVKDGNEDYVVLGEFKMLMEANKPVQRVVNRRNIRQVFVNAYMFEAMTGVRVHYGLVLYATRRGRLPPPEDALLYALVFPIHARTDPGDDVAPSPMPGVPGNLEQRYHDFTQSVFATAMIEVVDKATMLYTDKDHRGHVAAKRDVFRTAADIFPGMHILDMYKVQQTGRDPAGPPGFGRLQRIPQEAAFDGFQPLDDPVPVVYQSGQSIFYSHTNETTGANPVQAAEALLPAQGLPEAHKISLKDYPTLTDNQMARALVRMLSGMSSAAIRDAPSKRWRQLLARVFQNDDPRRKFRLDREQKAFLQQVQADYLNGLQAPDVISEASSESDDVGGPGEVSEEEPEEEPEEDEEEANFLGAGPPSFGRCEPYAGQSDEGSDLRAQLKEKTQAACEQLVQSLEPSRRRFLALRHAQLHDYLKDLERFEPLADGVDRSAAEEEQEVRRLEAVLIRALNRLVNDRVQRRFLAATGALSGNPATSRVEVAGRFIHMSQRGYWPLKWLRYALSVVYEETRFLSETVETFL